MEQQTTIKIQAKKNKERRKEMLLVIFSFFFFAEKLWSISFFIATETQTLLFLRMKIYILIYDSL
jgi:hypothetical protein